MLQKKKKSWEKHVDLLFIGEEGKRHCVLIKDFNTFMCNHALNRREKHCCRHVYNLSLQK